jgi:YVTN family beta-propeller protein
MLALAGPARAADVVATVGVGNNPGTVAITPDGASAYITNRLSDNVSVLSLVSNTVVATIPVGALPWGVAVTPDGSRVFVANRTGNTVSIINTATNTVVGSIPLTGGPSALAMSADGTRLYAARFLTNQVTAIDTATLTPVATVAVGTGPLDIALSDDGAFAFTANYNAATVSVLALPAMSVVATVPVGTNPYGVDAAGRGSGVRAFVANSVVTGNTVSEIGVGGGGWGVLRTIPVPGRPVDVALSADGGRLYVTQYDAGSLAAVSVANGAILSTTPLTPGIAGIALSPDGSRAVVLKLASAPFTATVIALVPQVRLGSARSVRGKTATGEATVTTDASPASAIRCLYTRQQAELADPYNSSAQAVDANPVTAAANGATEVTCDLEGLKRGRTYFYTVLASDPDGIGAASAPQSFTTRPPKPDKPRVVRKKRKLRLTWEPVRTATQYKARIRKGGSYKEVAHTGPAQGRVQEPAAQGVLQDADPGRQRVRGGAATDSHPPHPVARKVAAGGPFPPAGIPPFSGPEGACYL